MSDDTDGSPTLAEQVADDLRHAFQALNNASLPVEQRATLHRRLLAITTTAKRDVARAHEQLGRLHRDLEAAMTTTESRMNE